MAKANEKGTCKFKSDTFKKLIKKKDGASIMCEKAKKEEVTIENILSTLITDMVANGATFDELALVTKMSKDVMDILNDYKFEFFKEKYHGGNNGNREGDAK